MSDELLIFAAVLVVPFPIGFALAHFRPHSRPMWNGLWAALPISLPCFAWALWITATEDLSCTQEPCDNYAVLWAMALYVIGVLTGITGFGVGLLGDAYARRRNSEKGGG